MKLIKQYKGILILLLGILVVLLPYLWFIRTPYFEEFKLWSQQNIILFSSSLVLIKIIGIIFPPLPGGLVIMGAIPIIGWWQAYLLDLTGTIIGGSITYFLGKKYGKPILRKLFDDKMVERVARIKIRKNREIESVFILRFLFGSTLTEIICYAAGMLGISYKNFMIATILSHMIVTIPIFYFANSIFEGRHLWINGVIVLVALPILWKLRGRYLE